MIDQIRPGANQCRPTPNHPKIRLRLVAAMRDWR
jgi:hypothetical protein